MSLGNNLAAIAKLAVKEINLVKSQKTALALVIMLPFVIMFILSVSFSEMDQFKSVELSVYFPEGNFNKDYYLEKLSSIEKVNLREYSSAEEVMASIREGRALVGISIRPPESETSTVKIDFYYDNSNPLAAKFFYSIVEPLVKNIGGEAVKEKLSSLWLKLSDVKDSLASQKENIDEYDADIEALGIQIEELETKLDEIDLSSIDSTIESNKSGIEDVNSDLDSFNSDFDSTEADIDSTRQALSDARAKADSYGTELDAAEEKITGYNAKLVDARETINQLISDSSVPAAAVSELQQVKAQLDSAIFDSESAVILIQQARTDLDQTKASLSGIETKLGTAKQKLNSARSSLNSLKSSLSTSESSLTGIQSDMQSIKESLNQTKQLISESVEFKDDARAELANAKEVFTGIISELEKLDSMNPESLSKPFIIYEQKIFDITSSGSIAPSALVIVLLMTCMLLTSVSVMAERAQGAGLRLKMSVFSPYVLISGKLLGQVIIAFLEALVILFLSFGILGVPIPASIPCLLLVILVVSVAFVALGLFVTIFAKTQSTAIMASLLLMIPMLFLSGIIVPLVLMESSMQLISSFMPLTIAHYLVSGALLRNLPSTSMLVPIAVLLTVSLAAIVLSSRHEYGH